MARMRKLRARISHNDSVQRYTKLGVDVYIGSGRFAGADTIQVEGPAGSRTLAFAKAAVCTGARASVLSMPGLKEAGYLTNETVFSLTELPQRIGVIGAGPIGCELRNRLPASGARSPSLRRFTASCRGKTVTQLKSSSSRCYGME